MKGITKDVIVRVEKFIFLTDFVVINMDEKESTMQVFLDRSFLLTSGALIDVLKRTITLRVKEEKEILYALPCTNPSSIYPIAENPRAPPL